MERKTDQVEVMETKWAQLNSRYDRALATVRAAQVVYMTANDRAEDTKLPSDTQRAWELGLVWRAQRAKFQAVQAEAERLGALDPDKD